jgi:hypothetical protein
MCLRIAAAKEVLENPITRARPKIVALRVSVRGSQCKSIRRPNVYFERRNDDFGVGVGPTGLRLMQKRCKDRRYRAPPTIVPKEKVDGATWPSLDLRDKKVGPTCVYGCCERAHGSLQTALFFESPISMRSEPPGGYPKRNSS